MNKKYINFLLTLLFPITLLGQLKTLDCSSIRSGIFYFYPLNSPKKFIITREGLIQKEINIQTSDTSFWKVTWKSDCIFNLKFTRRTQPISDQEKLFLTSHNTIIKILSVTKDYYVFKANINLGNTISTLTDTLWIKPK